ncbi:MAG: preprotein translocase subunit SecY [Planctomycetes bacterium]|nr:preprotein translocase subunit SecY [Planctomycetota bacterium]
MINTLINVFRIAELRNKVLFTLAMLVVYRIGHWIPLPGVNQEQLTKFFENQSSDSAFGKIASVVAIFSGGAFSHSTIFGLGVMPYITAGIIFQVFASVYPPIKKIQEEGPTGRQKIIEWTRYITVALCVVQGIGWLTYLGNLGMVYQAWYHNPIWWVMSVAALTAGTVFLMWIGEQIDRHGIGNGVSMIIMAGILTQMPTAIERIKSNFDPADPQKLGWGAILALCAGFVIVVAGSVLMTVAQRRIPVQQAKHTKGKRVFGGQRSYLPLKINHGGVMPIVFASSIMAFPAILFATLTQRFLADGGWPLHISSWLQNQSQPGAFPYVLVYIAMVYFFSYFWITVQFNPEDMSKQLKEHGSFIPGLRPGPRTAEYLETVITRVTFVGAAFLSVIAVLPMVIHSALNIDFTVSQFFGGTGLLIVVSVALDFLQRVEANLLMRNYSGFLAGENEDAPRLRSARA